MALHGKIEINTTSKKHTPGTWGHGDVTAKYKPAPIEDNMIAMIAGENLYTPFDCISIGTSVEQVALIPCDNPHSKANAKLISVAPELLKVMDIVMMPVNDNVIPDKVWQSALWDAAKTVLDKLK